MQTRSAATATTAAIDAAMPSICTQTGVFMERMAETILMPWKTLPPGEFIRIWIISKSPRSSDASSWAK